MKNVKIKHLVVCAAGVVLTLNTVVMAQTLALNEAPPGTVRTDAYQWGAGFGFYVPEGVGTTINALGFWDPTGEGLQNNTLVALYSYASGSSYNLVTYAVIPAASPDLNYDGYDWVSVPTTFLADNGQGGDYYDIFAAPLGGDEWTTMNTGNPTLNPAIGTYAGGCLVDNNSGENISPTPPSNLADVDSNGGADSAGFGGANLGYFPTPVPEPGVGAILGGGLAMLLAVRRKNQFRWCLLGFGLTW